MLSSLAPLFIIGNPRSGTTVLRLLLTNHTQVSIPPECGFLLWLYPEFNEWHVDCNKSRLDDFLTKLESCRKFDTWNINISQLKSYILLKNPVSYAQLCMCIYEFYALDRNHLLRVWGDKNNYYLDHLDRLKEIYPNAHFLHIVRDGRDVFSSYLQVMSAKHQSAYAPQLTTDVSSVAGEWCQSVFKISSFMERQSSDNSFTIRYEDLVTNPDMVMGSVCSWLGINYEKKILDFYLTNQKKELEPKEMLSWKMKTIEPIDSSSVGRFKKILSQCDLDRFEFIAGNALIKFGYKNTIKD